MVFVRPGMTLWQRSIRQPQTLWIRRAIFQIHLWMGLGVGLYVIVISVTGSALVCSRQIEGKWSRKPVHVSNDGRPRLTISDLRERAQALYPSYEVLSVVEPQGADLPDSIVLERGGTRISRLFDPYTGTDFGDPLTMLDHAIGWLADLHDNLLGGLTGRTWNGIGSVLVVLFGITGAAIWWPGSKNWRRSMTINWHTRFARWNWDVHSAVGFWSCIFVLIWGISGICLCFPGSLDFLLSDNFRYWIARLHFGRFNAATEALWIVFGLAPAVLAVTGALMWWNRVLTKKLRYYFALGSTANKQRSRSVPGQEAADQPSPLRREKLARER
jgi:uncharacterized iron-regulated membrane protein